MKSYQQFVKKNVEIFVNNFKKIKSKKNVFKIIFKIEKKC